MKRDQLHVTCFFISLFNAQHVSDVNTSILRSLRLLCWVISWVVLLWYDACCSYVVIWLGWCGTWMQAEALVPNHTVTPTHIEPEQYNKWNNSTKKSQAPEDGCINIWNMLSIKCGSAGVVWYPDAGWNAASACTIVKQNFVHQVG